MLEEGEKALSPAGIWPVQQCNTEVPAIGEWSFKEVWICPVTVQFPLNVLGTVSYFFSMYLKIFKAYYSILVL